MSYNGLLMEGGIEIILNEPSRVRGRKLQNIHVGKYRDCRWGNSRPPSLPELKLFNKTSKYGKSERETLHV